VGRRQIEFQILAELLVSWRKTAGVSTATFQRSTLLRVLDSTTL
jgi:hypothetical protein